MKRVLVFWMWNDELDAAEIRRQIREFHLRRIEGFFIHAMPSEFRPDDFPGGMPGYLSEKFFAMVKVAVETAAELGMEAWLYDEGGWPSGTLNGRLAAAHPEWLSHSILPTGEIRAQAFRPDLLNREVTEFFIRETHEKYAAVLREYFGTVVPGIFTDEPYFGRFAPGRELPWSPVLEARFRELCGYEARDAASLIHRDNDAAARQDYARVWVSLMLDGFLRPIQQWCHRNGLLSVGHFNGDDTPENSIGLLGAGIFDLHQGFDICGCDAIWRQIHPLVPETDFTRLTVAAAQGKPTLSETFAVYGADLSLAEMKQVAAMQFVSGIGAVAPMAVHYSDRGGRQVTTMSNFFGADPRWEHYGAFSDFTRRMAQTLDRTVPVVKATVPFPVTGLRRGSYSGKLFPEALRLAARQITYDYAPDAPEPGTDIPSDLRLAEPCPELRTRHLKSPRGERRILVNSGTDLLRCRFAAPEGFNVWYDPATGTRTPARADGEGMLTLELPFSGVMVLLTLPGRSQPAAAAAVGTETVAVNFRPVKVTRLIRATAEGLREVPPPEAIPEKFSGTLLCEAEVEVAAEQEAELFLPAARRAMIVLRRDGEAVGTRVWGPYRWRLRLHPGKNRLTAEISGTPAAAFYAPEHVRFLRENGFFNGYAERCEEFAPLFPEERPLEDACLLLERNA